MSDLDKLSLLTFVSIRNTFTWFFATPETRKWVVSVEVRLGEGLVFQLEGKDLAEVLREALARVTEYYLKNGYEQYLS